MNLFIKYKIFFRWLVYVIVVNLLIIVDQASKFVVMKFLKNYCINGNCEYKILPVFDFAYVCNSGVSYGMLDSLPMGDIILSIVAILAIFLFIYLIYRSQNNIEIASFLLIIGGAIGNLIDRISNSCVTDFLQVHYKSHYFPVFNMADTFITIGGFLLVYLEIKKFYNKNGAK